MKKLRHVFYLLLCRVIKFQIDNELFQHKGLKKGDKVKWNWKAKIYIKSAILDTINEVMEVDFIEKDDIEFTNGEGCDPFWVSKVYWQRR